jgi:hypothetical protein
MRHASILVAVPLFGAALVAAPVPQEPKALVAGLNDPSRKVRDETTAALTNRPDAAPWLRRAVRSSDRDTAARAAKLLTGYAKNRQEIVKQALDACIRDGRPDLFVEWHHFWQSEETEDLWPVGPRMGKAGVDEYAQHFPQWKPTAIEKMIEEYSAIPRVNFCTLDGPFAKFPEVVEARTDGGQGPWRFRTDQLRLGGRPFVTFASVAGPIRMWESPGGYYFALGGIEAHVLRCSLFVCDGGLGEREERDGEMQGPRISGCYIASRGDAAIPRASVKHSILLVDGDIDLSLSKTLEDSVIRASGEILLPKDYKPVNCMIEPHAKNATAPYRFFGLADVGLSVVDDEEGMVVAEVKPGTPLGNCGLAKGDVIQAIDDVWPGGHSSEFRKKVRRAMVVQGDCLLTVARGAKTLDFAVYFPTPK